MIRFRCRHRRGDFLLDAAFEAGPGVTALFGPSGSGKTSIVHLVAGLERPDEGFVAIDEHVLVDTAAGRFARPHARRLGLVFQDARLFPHLSVANNLVYGRWFTPHAERRVAFDAVVDVLGLAPLLARRPATLSGGERQRVALGRALLTSPRALLMDEPLASLDEPRKQEILPFVERLRDEFRIPILYVSHALAEVVRLAATVVRIDSGRVVAAGSPAEVLSTAKLSGGAERFAAASLIACRVESVANESGLSALAHPSGRIVTPRVAAPAGAEVVVAIRATDVAIARVRPEAISIRTILAARVARIETGASPFALVTLAVGPDKLLAYVTRQAVEDLALTAGAEVFALVKSVAIDERVTRGSGR
jgi:molybdate transport system ATP-binding protein